MISNRTMKKTNLTILALIASALFAVTGCGRHKAMSQMTTGSSDGRQLAVVIDGKASFKTRGREHVVTFGGHELVVGTERLVVDRDKKSFGIPSAAKKVDIEVTDGVLTMSVDGSLLIKTPI